MKSSALTESKLDIQARSNGLVISFSNYNPDLLRSYYADPTCWVQMQDSKQLGIKHKTQADTFYIVNLNKGEAKIEKFSNEELKPSQQKQFSSSEKYAGEIDFRECITSRKSIGYNTQYEAVLVNRNPLNTIVMDSGFWYVGSIRGRNQKDYVWWVEACNGRYGLVETPAQSITRMLTFDRQTIALDEKGQAYSVNIGWDKQDIRKFCSASQICEIGEILKPHQEFFWTTDRTNTLTIWKAAKFSHAIKFLQFQNVVPTIKPVSTHNGKLFFVSQNGIEFCNTRTWETQTLVTFEREDQPSQLLLSYNQRRLMYINRKGINVLELGDDALFYAQKYISTDCHLYGKIANTIMSYAKENFSAEFCYECDPVPAYEDPTNLKEEPYEALASCKFLDTLPGFLRQSTQDLLIELLKQAKEASAAVKQEIHENIDALLFLFFLYDKFPKNYITDNINQVLKEFPKILTSENSILLKSLFDSYVGLDSGDVRKRYIGFFEVKAPCPKPVIPEPVRLHPAQPAIPKPLEKPAEIKPTRQESKPEKISYKKEDSRCLIM